MYRQTVPRRSTPAVSYQLFLGLDTRQTTYIPALEAAQPLTGVEYDVPTLLAKHHVFVYIVDVRVIEKKDSHLSVGDQVCLALHDGASLP